MEMDSFDRAARSTRTGDGIDISGDYQYKALTEGNTVQRFWHYSKMLAIRELLPPSQNDAVVDVGCGSGVISAFLGTLAGSVVGIDSNLDAIEFATRAYSDERISFRVGLADEPLGSASSADKIYCLELIEHIYSDQCRVMLDNFHRLLRPGGRVMLTTPNYHSMWPIIEWLMDRFRLAPPMADHQHVEPYHRKKLRNACVTDNFHVECLRSICLFGPWVAPFSWRLAEALTRLELRLSYTPGSVLVCILSKVS